MAWRGHRFDGDAFEADRAGARMQHAGEGFERRALAGAVAAKQRHDFALAHRHGDVEQNVGIAVIGIDALDLDHGYGAAGAAFAALFMALSWRHPAEIGLPHQRIAGDFLRRAFGQHAAFVQNGDALGKFEHRVHVVLDENDGAALARVCGSIA